jgi:hypothetical protein
MQSPEKNSTQTPAKKRVQLKHVQLDHNFFEKPKIIALGYRFKEAGQLLFISTLCLMAKATDSEIDIDCVRAEASRLLKWDETKADEFIAYIIERDLVHRGSKPFLIANRRILEDQENMAAKQEKWRESKRTQRGHVEDNSRRVNTELLNTEDLKSEISKSDFPKSLDTAEHRAAIAKWCEYSAKKHRKVISEMEIEALLLNWSSRAKELIPAINQSIERGWKGIIYKPPDEKPQYNKIPGTTAVTVSMETSMHPAAVAERRRIQKAKEKEAGHV